MKNVVLIGDSIRMGYQDTVRTELESHAAVWAPEQNGGNSENVLAHFDDWVIARQPDILHINCGLHDLRTEFGQTAAAVPLERYEANLRTIITRAKEETDAMLIWALTTPVNQEWHHNNKDFDRFEADVSRYNAVALDLARELNVVVNDLFSIITDNGRDELLLPDGVHFKPDGYALLGKSVADFIRNVSEASGKDNHA